MHLRSTATEPGNKTTNATDMYTCTDKETLDFDFGRLRTDMIPMPSLKVKHCGDEEWPPASRLFLIV